MPRGVRNPKPVEVEDVVEEAKVEDVIVEEAKVEDVIVEEVVKEEIESLQDEVEEVVEEIVEEVEVVVEDVVEDVVEEVVEPEVEAEIIEVEPEVVEVTPEPEVVEIISESKVVDDEYKIGQEITFRLPTIRTYDTSVAKLPSRKPGPLYIYDTLVQNDRIRVSNRVNGEYLGWVSLNDLSKN